MECNIVLDFLCHNKKYLMQYFNIFFLSFNLVEKNTLFYNKICLFFLKRNFFAQNNFVNCFFKGKVGGPMSMSSPHLKMWSVIWSKTGKHKKRAEQRLLCKEKIGRVWTGERGGRVWWDRKKLKVTFAIESCGEGHVVQGTGYSITAGVGCHPSNAIFSLVRRQLPPQLIHSDVVLQGGQIIRQSLLSGNWLSSEGEPPPVPPGQATLRERIPTTRPVLYTHTGSTLALTPWEDVLLFGQVNGFYSKDWFCLRNAGAAKERPGGKSGKLLVLRPCLPVDKGGPAESK